MDLNYTQFLIENLIQIQLQNTIYVKNKSIVERTIIEFCDKIFKLIENIAKINNRFTQDSLIDLTNIDVKNINEAILKIEESLFSLGEKDQIIYRYMDSNQYLHEKFFILKNEIKNLFKKIKGTKKIQEAFIFFNYLDNIHIILSKLFFKNEITIDKNLEIFIYDFDRLDEDEVLENLYSKIKRGDYF